MPTIIDALAITLALDASKFIKGQKEVDASLKKTKETAVAHGKEIETAMTATSAGVGKLVAAFLGLGAVLTGGKGVQQFMTDVTKTDSALGRFARGVNMSTKDVQAFDGAVQSIGGSAGEAQSGIQALSDSFQSLKTFGDPGVVRALAILSSKGGKRIDPLKPVDKNTLLDLAEDLGKIAKTDPTHASFLGRQLGLPPNVVSALMKGREEFAKLLEIQEKYAASTADIDAADKRQSAWQRLKAAGEATGRTILSIFTPALLELNKAFLSFVESVKEHMPEIKAAWDNFWAGLEPIAKPVFAFLKSALKGFGTFASDTFSLVKNAFFGSSDDIRNSWKKLFDDMNDTLSNWATEMWEKIPRIFKRIFDWIEGRFNAIWTAAFGRPLFPESGGAGAGGSDAGGAGGNKQLPRPQGPPGSDGGPIEHSAPIPGKGSAGGSAEHSAPLPGKGSAGGPVEHSAPVGHSAAPAYGPRLPGGGKRTLMGRGTSNDGYGDFYDAIIRAEGTAKKGDPYNEVLGYGKYGRPPKPLTDMTLSEVYDWGHNVLRPNSGVNSSAVGAFQIVGSTMRTYMGAAGLGWDDKFTPENQRKLAVEIARGQGISPGTWAGFGAHPREMQIARDAFRSGGSASGPSVATTPSDTNAYTAPGAGAPSSFNGQKYTDYYKKPSEAATPKLKDNMTRAEIDAWNKAHGGAAAGNAWQKALHSLARPHEHAKKLLQHIGANVPNIPAGTRGARFGGAMTQRDGRVDNGSTVSSHAGAWQKQHG